MNLPDIQLMVDYNCWANGQILNAAGKASAEQFTQHTEHSHGSLRGTLVHTLDAEEGWRSRLIDGHPTPDLSEDTFPTLESLIARWQNEQQTLRAYLATLNDADLNGIAKYTIEDKPFERVRWHMLMHLINHGSQHRAESAVMLTSYGASPGDLDLMLYIRDYRGK